MKNAWVYVLVVVTFVNVKTRAMESNKNNLDFSYCSQNQNYQEFMLQSLKFKKIFEKIYGSNNNNNDFKNAYYIDLIQHFAKICKSYNAVIQAAKTHSLKKTATDTSLMKSLDIVWDDFKNGRKAASLLEVYTNFIDENVASLVMSDNNHWQAYRSEDAMKKTNMIVREFTTAYKAMVDWREELGFEK